MQYGIFGAAASLTRRGYTVSIRSGAATSLIRLPRLGAEELAYALAARLYRIYSQRYGTSLTYRRIAEEFAFATGSSVAAPGEAAGITLSCISIGQFALSNIFLPESSRHP